MGLIDDGVRLGPKYRVHFGSWVSIGSNLTRLKKKKSVIWILITWRILLQTNLKKRSAVHATIDFIVPLKTKEFL